MPPLSELQGDRWHVERRRCAFRPKRAPGTDGWPELVNQIHLRLHLVFAGEYLQRLEDLGPEQPANDENLSVVVEIAVDPSSGELTHIAVPKPSGQVLFDAIALESFLVAFPVSVPATLRTSGAPLLLKWELHRLPEFACSTFFSNPLELRPTK